MADIQKVSLRVNAAELKDATARALEALTQFKQAIADIEAAGISVSAIDQGDE